jgi:hypothetical protein
MQLALSLDKPRLRLWRGFLSPAECELLISIATPRLSRSSVVTIDTPGSRIAEDRTSDGMSFNASDVLMAEVNARAALVTGRDPRTFETLQLLRYRPGQQYLPHFDYFPLDYASTPAELQRGGQRTGTMLIYLQTPDAGGATTFPDAGVTVEAIAGDALYFEYDRPEQSTLTRHGGAPVTAGEKFVATLWMRQQQFDGPARDLRIVDDVLTYEQCVELRRAYDAGTKEGPPDYVVRLHPDTREFPFRAQLNRVQHVMSQQYGDAMSVETVVIGCMPPGWGLTNHADNVRWENGQYVPNHTPERTHTAVVFLQDGTGGTVTYGENPSGQQYAVDVTQKQGRMHAHRCGPNYHHRVSAPDAPRYTFIVWFKKVA